MVIERIADVYERINPVTQLAIKPALKAVDAHRHKIRGGIAAALASGIGHYTVFELIGQLLDIRDPQIRLMISELPIAVHMLIITHMIWMLGIGIYKNSAQQNER